MGKRKDNVIVQDVISFYQVASKGMTIIEVFLIDETQVERYRDTYQFSGC